MPSIGEMVSFHRLERQIYARVLSLGNPVSTARNIVSLWMYLQLIGIDLLHYINDCRDDSVFARFVSEAESILQCIIRTARTPRSVAIPLTASMATEELNLRFFYFNKDAIARGMTYILENIGRSIIFETNGFGDLTRVYYNRVAPNPVDCRTLFVTFHRSGLRKQDITEFFERRWGNCVENVMIEQTARGVVPVYGRIVLINEYFLELVFNNRPVLVMEINGSHITVRKFSTN